MALLLPLTFSMSPVSAIILLSCMYWGALFGGSITSILFNIPGEPSSVATTFDGYPMARNGQAGEALTAAFTSALLGALVGVLLLTFLSTHIARFALAFSSPEFFAVYLLAFCTFIGMSRNPPLKTLVAMTIGFAMAAVGMDTVSGELRLTFDQPWLLSGLSFEVAVIGLFGIGEILCTVEEGLVFRGEARTHHADGDPAYLGQAAALLADLAAQRAGRLLDGRHSGRPHRRLVHELQPGAALLEEPRELRLGRGGRRDRSGDSRP